MSEPQKIRRNIVPVAVSSVSSLLWTYIALEKSDTLRGWGFSGGQLHRSGDWFWPTAIAVLFLCAAIGNFVAYRRTPEMKVPPAITTLFGPQ
jgi:hypothetical protein